MDLHQSRPWDEKAGPKKKQLNSNEVKERRTQDGIRMGQESQCIVHNKEGDNYESCRSPPQTERIHLQSCWQSGVTSSWGDILTTLR